MIAMNVFSIRGLRVLLLVSTLFSMLCWQELHARTQSFNDAVVEVVKAFDSRDSDRVNRLIHPDYGIVVLYREGLFDRFAKVARIDFERPIPDVFSYQKVKVTTRLRYAALPVYDCHKEAWSKTGLFCDLKGRDKLLSNTAVNLRAFRGDDIPQSLINRFRDLEARSVRIVLVDDNGADLVFYLTRIGSRWYLTILDRVSSDCSA